MQDLVLIPGLLCSPALWAHQTTHLAPHARVTVADVSTSDTLDGMARAVLESAPARFALAGLSMGGMVANAIMRIAPERVERLALLDTSAQTETAEQTVRREALLALAAADRFDEVTETLLPALVHPDRLADAALVGAVRGMARDIGADAFRRQISAIVARPDPRPAMAGYHCPTLVLCGREDVITPPAFHEEMAALIPGARLAVIEQCGHLATMERPQAVTALLSQWLLYD
ncbi:MAG: alpha/beta fold hydrolase [Gammaproteobacteria bacterium]